LPASPPPDEREAVAQLRALLTESVRLRLISDVPIGAFLSGGIDSGAIVALMAEARSGPVRTFSSASMRREETWTRPTTRPSGQASGNGTHAPHRDRPRRGGNRRSPRPRPRPTLSRWDQQLCRLAGGTDKRDRGVDGSRGTSYSAGYPHFWRLHWEYRNGGWPHRIRREIKAALAATGNLIEPWLRGTALDRICGLGPRAARFRHTLRSDTHPAPAGATARTLHPWIGGIGPDRTACLRLPGSLDDHAPMT